MTSVWFLPSKTYAKEIILMTTKKSKKSRKVTDVKMAQANDTTVMESPVRLSAEDIVLQPETPVVPVNGQPVATPAPVDVTKLSAVGKGAHYTRMAGKPSKAALILCFGKQGYQSLSWGQRAEKLGITAEELVADFVKDPSEVKARWEAAVAAAKKATTKS
jgi:hypothetical protein